MSLFDNTTTMRSIQILEQGVDAAVLRRKVLANNISNVDVPHFKRSEVIFEAELRRAVDLERAAKEEQPLRRSHPLHIAKRSYPHFRSVNPSVAVDHLSTMRNDGNNVDIEDEVVKLVRNQARYSLMIDRLGANFRMLNQLLRLP